MKVDKSGFFRVVLYRSGEFSLKRTSKAISKSSEKILLYFKQNPDAGAKSAAKMFGLTQRAIEKQIAILKKQKRLRRVGPDKGGLWEVVVNKATRELK